MSQQMEEYGTTKMRPRARMISLIGEELISDEPVAVVELVKNAYDADATCVTIQFDSAQPSQICIEDDGHGMTLEVVLSAWFEPGTVSKRQTDRSPRGRIYQGAKGIGRFASARLAETLLLETRTGPDVPATTVLLDWGKFDDESYLDNIELDWQLSETSDLKHGTRLTLAGLRKTWESEDYDQVHSRLSRLISPFEDISDFTIHLEVPARNELSGEVRTPQLLTEPRYQLEGSLDSRGYFTGTIHYGGKVAKKINSQKLGAKNSNPLCGPFAVQIRVWDRDREGLDSLANFLGMKISEIRGILNVYSGISIYRDGFRVHPYGQRGNDWLNLDNRSRQNPVMRLGNNQIVAAIQISRDQNPELSDRSNREGMLLNDAHSSLEAWFVEVLSILESYRYDVRPRREAQTFQQPLFELFDIADVAEEARTALGKNHPVAGVVTRIERQVNEGVERVQEAFSRLLLSAGLGQMVDLVIHEIGAPLGKVNRQLTILEQVLQDSSDQQLKKKLAPMVTSIKGWLEQIHGLRQRLDPQTAGRRGRATSFDVGEEIQDTFNLYAAVLESKDIAFEIISPSEPVKVRMSRAALGQVLANLVDNSIYWVSRVDGEGNIRVRLTRIESGFTLEINDSGPGIEAEDQTKIFEPYFSRKPNGMGLGLYIARLVIEPYGRLVHRDEGDLPGACLEAIFERSVGL